MQKSAATVAQIPIIIMNIKYFFLSLIILLPGALFSQIPLTNGTLFMQGEDILCRTEVPFVEPGPNGKNAVWKLSRLLDGHDDLWQTITRSDASINILEYDRMKHFEIKDDILYYMGACNGKSFVELEEGRLLMKYPFQYGDSIYSNYSGKGCEEDGLSYTLTGTSYTVADGVGSLSDGKDEIQGVTRLHLHDEMKKTYENGTAGRIASDRYMWYANDRSYPVMESVMSLLERDGASDVVERVSYAYFHVQSGTNTIEHLDKDDAMTEKYASRMVEIVKTSFSSADLKLTVDYSLDEEALLDLIVTDIAGNVLGTEQYHSGKGGDGQIFISLARRPIGGVLMLNVTNGNQRVSVKVRE